MTLEVEVLMGGQPSRSSGGPRIWAGVQLAMRGF